MALDGEAGALTIIASIANKISQLSKPSTQLPSIYKVHKHLRDVNKKAYEPEIVAIGPYHHGKDNLKMMEERKLRYLEALLKRKPYVKVEDYISAVAQMEDAARDCYAEPISLTSAEFIEMLVLDGCFIIELLILNSTESNNDPIIQIGWINLSLQRDLILFENQIPFFVLCKLFDLIENPNQHMWLIKLVLVFCLDVFPGAKLYEATLRRRSDQVKHLLDLIHSNWCDPSNLQVRPQTTRSHLIPSATELTDGNVKFKKKECSCTQNDVECSCTQIDVDFKKGHVLMPPLEIGDTTECIFRNLIAYEQYFANNQPQPTLVTDYMVLLDCLISSSKDVEILSHCGIIDNLMGDNEEVAKIVNQLGKSVIYSPDHFFYAGTFSLINNHYKRCWNRAMATFHRDYFNSPWAYVSFVAALLLLLLTGAQTVFSALQVV